MFKSASVYGRMNSYDIMKLCALLAMVADHLGVYFWPDAEWLRAIGRMAFPLFLFLVGYSCTWKTKYELLALAVLIVICAAITHHHIIPVNILFTIALIRLMMSYVVRFQITPGFLCASFIICLVWFPLFIWIDYSTIAFLFAMSGYLQKQKPDSSEAVLFLYAAVAAHCVIQYFSFGFNALNTIIMFAFMACAVILMHNFRLEESRPARKKDKDFLLFLPFHLPDSVNNSLRWIARNTLLIYAGHVMIFMIAERILYPARLGNFQWL